MWFRHRAWKPIAWFLALINLGSVWFAAAEPWHATIHALLAGLFALGAQRLGRRPTTDVSIDASLEERVRELEARDVEARLGELEERLDFTERALIDVRARANLPAKE